MAGVSITTKMISHKRKEGEKERERERKEKGE